MEENYENEPNFQYDIEKQDNVHKLGNQNENSFDTQVKKELTQFECETSYSDQNFISDDLQESQNYVENKDNFEENRNCDTFWKGDPLSLSKSMVPNADGTLTCLVCKKDFKSKTTLREHVKNVHEKIKPFVCHVCNERFAKKQLMEKHFKVW